MLFVKKENGRYKYICISIIHYHTIFDICCFLAWEGLSSGNSANCMKYFVIKWKRKLLKYPFIIFFKQSGFFFIKKFVYM